VVKLAQQKVFREVLSFLVAVSLVNIPIVCVNDLSEWTQMLQ
jgi:hypothetical protein